MNEHPLPATARVHRSARLSAIFLFFFLLLFMSQARADWQYTKWGMSPQQVLAASGGRAYFNSEREKNNWSRLDGLALLSAPYAANGMKFRADFIFDSRQYLKAVAINLEEYANVNRLYSDLVTKYGIARHCNIDSLARDCTWLHPADNLSLNFQDQRYMRSAAVLYQPAFAALSPGL